MTLTILLVDDGKAERFLIGKILRTVGCSQIEEACDAVEAMKRAEAVRPDILLMDTHMPGMNGYDACRQIRQTEYGKAMAIIGMSTVPCEDKWAQAGADNFVNKTDLIEGFLDEIALIALIQESVSKYKK